MEIAKVSVEIVKAIPYNHIYIHIPLSSLVILYQGLEMFGEFLNTLDIS